MEPGSVCDVTHCCTLQTDYRGGQVAARRSRLAGVGVAAAMSALAKRNRAALVNCIFA